MILIVVFSFLPDDYMIRACTSALLNRKGLLSGVQTPLRAYLNLALSCPSLPENHPRYYVGTPAGFPINAHGPESVRGQLGYGFSRRATERF